VTRYRLDPAESLFIDDSEINVRGADAAGFRTHHFVNAASLAAALAQHGLTRDREPADPAASDS
jgi:FMN phosphatase YigB (HAD superfamily)